MINNAKRDLNQVLKNQDVELIIRLNIAKGVININNLIKTYLRDCIKTKFNNSIEIKLFIIPSNENALKVELFRLIVEFSFFTNSVKEIFTLKIDSPNSRIDRDMYEFIVINCSHKKNEQLISIVNIINLNKNCIGFSISIDKK